MERDHQPEQGASLEKISIHALRMERDRTQENLINCIAISIHALRMERDRAAGPDLGR